MLCIVRCLYQRCDLVSLSVICILDFNNVCPFAGSSEKVLCPDFKEMTK